MTLRTWLKNLLILAICLSKFANNVVLPSPLHCLYSSSAWSSTQWPQLQPSVCLLQLAVAGRLCCTE